MIKLLIADDESLVCVGLRSLLRWEELGVEIVGTARNGVQAAAMIEELRPDIVVTDIRLPLKSGLDLIEECAQKYGRVPLFIFLTSYEDFEYARRAMKSQAVDYLVKLELTPESMLASIQKALGLLAKEEKLAAAGIAGGSSQRLLREKFFLHLYNNLFESETQLEAMRQEAGVDLNAPAFAVAVCEIMETQNGQPGIQKPAALRDSAMEMAQETLRKSVQCYTTAQDSNMFLITFCIPEQNPASQKELLENALDKTIAMARSYFSVSLRVAVGHIVAAPRDLSESYLSAKRAAHNASNDAPLFIMERQSHAKQLISQIQGYIRERVGERLSQNDVASEFGLSSGYLSQLFSKHVDMGFVEYITSERVAAAKEMLAAEDKRINEIAGLVGFENAFYFSSVFKKLEGVSPREYQRRLRGDAGEED